MENMNSPVLLLGYNRTEYIKTRLIEIMSWDPPRIYISIDGPKNENESQTHKEINDFLFNFRHENKITIYSNQKNLGLSNHITGAITSIFKIEDNLIIIEDDIEIFKNAYLSMSKILNNSNLNKFAIVSGFSSIPAPPKFLRKFLLNKFRVATYTSMWGWGIRKEIWSLYELDISRSDRKIALSKSKLWNKLSSRQKSIWLQRFNKVSDDPKKTWDFQMQFMCFKHDIPNLSPIFRAVDNVGFDDTRSTHTKYKKPKFYFGKTDYRQIEGVTWGGLVPKITDFADGFSDLIPYLKKFISPKSLVIIFISNSKHKHKK
jgi:hypothetical protein